MPHLNQILKQELDSATQRSRGLSSMSMNQSFLPVFKRVARIDATQVSDAVDIYVSNMKSHRWNAVYSLYALAVIADVSAAARGLVSAKLNKDEIDYYIGDEDSSVSGNAKVLNEVLSGEPLSKFEEKEKEDEIMELKPNFYGFSLNIKSLIKKIRSFFNDKK